MDLKPIFFRSPFLKHLTALSPTIVADYILKDTHAHVLVREDNAQWIFFCVGFSNFEDFLRHFFCLCMFFECKFFEVFQWI